MAVNPIFYEAMLNSPNPTNTLPAKKHLAALGQISVLILLAAVFFRLRVIESAQYTDDFENIMALGRLAQLPVHQTLVASFDSDEEFRKAFDLHIQNQLSTWLHQHYQQIDESHREVRQMITDWLAKDGLSNTELAQLSGKGFGDQYPFILFYSFVPPLDSPLKNEVANASDPPIALLLEETRQLSYPAKFMIAVALQDSSLPKLDFPVSQDPMGIGFRLDNVVLSQDGEVQVTFRQNTGPSQQVPQSQEFKILAVTKTIENVDLLPIIVGTVDEQRLVGIGANEAIFQHLLQTYGQLRLSQGIDVTTKLVFDNYQKVEMLGFSFSAAIFWIFVFISQFACLVAAVIYLRHAVSEDDHTPTALGLNFLLGSRAVRIILWCVLPSISMILAYPQQIWTVITIATYWGAILILILAGVFVYRLSLKPRPS